MVPVNDFIEKLTEGIKKRKPLPIWKMLIIVIIYSLALAYFFGDYIRTIKWLRFG